MSTPFMFLGLVAVTVVLTAAITGMAQMTHGTMEGHAPGENPHMMNMTGSMTSEPMIRHGGTLEASQDLDFETVCTESDVRVYVTDSGGNPVDPSGIKGSVSVEREGEKPMSFPLSAKRVSDDPMAKNRMMPGMIASSSEAYLGAQCNVDPAASDSVTLHIMLNNLPGEAGTTAHWAVPYALTPLFGMACPMHPEQASLDSGECSICEGMALQPARVLYTCCPACGDMRRTQPGKCEKCGMDLSLKAVEKMTISEMAPAQMRHGADSH
jgi:hypothetical protein